MPLLEWTDGSAIPSTRVYAAKETYMQHLEAQAMETTVISHARLSFAMSSIPLFALYLHLIDLRSIAHQSRCGSPGNRAVESLLS